MAQVNVTVDEAHLADIEAVAEALRGHGMTVTQVLPTVGIISGSVDNGQVAALDQVEGVAAVDGEQDVQIPPPDAPIQ